MCFSGLFALFSGAISLSVGLLLSLCAFLFGCSGFPGSINERHKGFERILESVVDDHADAGHTAKNGVKSIVSKGGHDCAVDPYGKHGRTTEGNEKQSVNRDLKSKIIGIKGTYTGP
jgi:hypothetical protein